MKDWQIILSMIGFVAYFIKAMQPDHFLQWIPRRINFHCFPCISGWLSAIIVLIWDFIVYNYDNQIIVNPIMFLFIGASGYALFKFME